MDLTILEFRNKTVDEILFLVNEIKRYGLEQGKDFDFSVNRDYGENSYSLETSVTFSFYNNHQIITFLRLRYA